MRSKTTTGQQDVMSYSDVPCGLLAVAVMSVNEPADVKHPSTTTSIQSAENTESPKAPEGLIVCKLISSDTKRLNVDAAGEVLQLSNT